MEQNMHRQYSDGRSVRSDDESHHQSNDRNTNASLEYLDYSNNDDYRDEAIARHSNNVDVDNESRGPFTNVKRISLSFEELMNSRPMFPDARQDEYKHQQVWDEVEEPQVRMKEEEHVDVHVDLPVDLDVVEPPWLNLSNNIHTKGNNASVMNRTYQCGRLSPMQTVDGLELISRSFPNPKGKSNTAGSVSRNSNTRTRTRNSISSSTRNTVTSISNSIASRGSSGSRTSGRSRVSNPSVGTAIEQREEYCGSISISRSSGSSNSSTTRTPYNPAINPSINTPTALTHGTSSIASTSNHSNNSQTYTAIHTTTPSQTSQTSSSKPEHRHKWKRKLASAFREIIHEMEQLYLLRCAATEEQDILFWDRQIAALKECALRLCEDPDGDWDEGITDTTSKSDNEECCTVEEDARKNMILLIAPADLPGAHSYITSYRGQSIVATVPPNGVSKGQTFYTSFTLIPGTSTTAITKATPRPHIRHTPSPQPKGIPLSYSSTSTSSTNYNTTTTTSTANKYIKVRAPASLPAGSRFNARCGKKTIVATVPTGGVVKGEVFSVLLLP